MTKAIHTFRTLLACIGLGVALFASCEKPDNSGSSVPVQSVSIVGLDGSSLTVPFSDTPLVFNISFNPENATVKSISATSSDPSVATAEAKLKGGTKAVGYPAELVVTLLSGGETDISVTVDGKKDVMHLVVEQEEPEIVFAVTGETSGISAQQVYCGMSMINSDKLPSFESYVMGGICYSDVNTMPVVPTVGESSTDNHDCGIALGVSFKAGQTPVDGEYNEIQISGLKAATKYYYRAFVWIDESETVYYGELKTFQTSDEPVIAAGEVDLGLSVNWWGCNIGATKPEEYGNYYAWGETSEKETYTLSNYKLRYNKYHTTQREEGYPQTAIKIDNKTILDAEDDIATITLGEEWRMPTVEEIRELKDLNPSIYELNGVKGLLVTGKNGNSMFIPFNGMKNEQSLYQGQCIMLWSCKASVDDALRAGAFETESQWGGVLNTYAYRFVGMGVRGVRAARPKDGPDLKYTDFKATDVTTNSATISLTVDIDDAQISYEGIGLQVSSDPEFKTLFAEENFGSTGGTFTMDLTNLSPACEYYVRAYVGTTTNGQYLGEVFSFTTESDVVEPYVDMGTGVLWASWDLGSEVPELEGSKYAWGETETKEEYTFENSKYHYRQDSKGRCLYSKYNSSDKLSTLLPEDDAVIAALGEGYRTPTVDDWAALQLNCTREEGSRNGVKGYIYTSKITGKTLFFPCKYYMTASVLIKAPDWDKYCNMNFYPNVMASIPETWTVETIIEYMGGSDRYRGQAIRPVKVVE